MYRTIRNACLLILLIQPGFQLPLRAQLYQLDFIYGGLEDAEAILQEYLKPFSDILGSDLNAGWYNTARPHKLGGLDFTATVSWSRAPSSVLSYDVSKLDLNGEADLTASATAPTIAGKQEERPVLTYTREMDINGNPQEFEYARFTLPDGAGVDFFPLPMAQLSVGLPFGTDVSARFVPHIGYRDYGEIGLWGVGGKHSISQWIPVVNKMKFLDVSLQGGYTKVTSSVHVSVEPLPTVEPEDDPNPDFNWDDQFVVLKVDGWTTNVIASQTLPVITFYQGIGYASSLVLLQLEGHYPIHTATVRDGQPRTTYEILEDPITAKYENFKNLRLNAGARIKLGVFTLHYDFTHTLYATHSVGMGISFR